jgi:hypothetical protein
VAHRYNITPIVETLRKEDGGKEPGAKGAKGGGHKKR